MTGKKDWNFPAFFTMADRLEALGYIPNNPAENDGPTCDGAVTVANRRHAEGRHRWADYMRLDVVRLVSCDFVVALAGWHHSRGARVEIGLARDLGMPVYEWSDSDGLILSKMLVLRT